MYTHDAEKYIYLNNNALYGQFFFFMLSPAILCLKKLIKMVIKRVPTRKVPVFKSYRVKTKSHEIECTGTNRLAEQN